MSGHSHWSSIKHKKVLVDQKRGKLFSGLLRTVFLAAQEEANPEFNPKLRQAIEKAKDAQIPLENIEKAIERAARKNLEELFVEAYGPAGIALLIEAITDNKQETLSSLKKTLESFQGKIAEKGSVLWAFEKKENDFQPKFFQEASEQDKNKLKELISKLEEKEEIQKVITNIRVDNV